MLLIRFHDDNGQPIIINFDNVTAFAARVGIGAGTRIVMIGGDFYNVQEPLETVDKAVFEMRSR